MNFTQVEPHENLNIQCYRSDSGDWEIGAYKTLYGMRVAVSNVRGEGYEIHYCCGDNWLMVTFTLQTLIHVFSQVKDDPKTVLMVCHAMPRQMEKPIREGDHIFNSLMALSFAADKWHSSGESEEPKPLIDLPE